MSQNEENRSVPDESGQFTIPPGWKLVPEEPTDEMAKASRITTDMPFAGRVTTWGVNVWNAMLAAAPKPPVSPSPDHKSAMEDVFGDFDEADYKPDLASAIATEVLTLKWTHSEAEGEEGAGEQMYRYGDVQEAVSRVLRAARLDTYSVHLGKADTSTPPVSPSPDSTRQGDAQTERVRHVKRGTEYEVLGEAEAQVSSITCPDGVGNGVLPKSRILREGRAGYESDRLTVYRCVTTGKLWCRFTDEFRDGRFEAIKGI